MAELGPVQPGLALRAAPGGKVEDGGEAGRGELEAGRVVPLGAVVAPYQVLGAGLPAVAVQRPLQTFYQPRSTGGGVGGARVHLPAHC